jgi:3-methyladenine DNA glycosylase/8-oxoguanine DNA glycosylase
MAPQKPEEIKALTTEMLRRINVNTGRIRAVERRLERTDMSLTSLKDTFLSHAEEFKVGLEKIDDKLSSVAQRLTTIEDELVKITKQLGRTATKVELSKLEKFVDLFGPLTTKFVTREELERALRRKRF